MPICYRCGGMGKVNESVRINCRACQGTGNAPMQYQPDPCSLCNGSGKQTITKSVTCVDCGGSGQNE